MINHPFCKTGFTDSEVCSVLRCIRDHPFTFQGCSKKKTRGFLKSHDHGYMVHQNSGIIIDPKTPAMVYLANGHF